MPSARFVSERKPSDKKYSRPNTITADASNRRRNHRTVRASSPAGHATDDCFGPFIRNPVVEYTYAEEDRVVASCDHGRVGTPLQESEGPRRALSPPDRVAA